MPRHLRRFFGSRHCAKRKLYLVLLSFAFLGWIVWHFPGGNTTKAHGPNTRYANNRIILRAQHSVLALPKYISRPSFEFQIQQEGPSGITSGIVRTDLAPSIARDKGAFLLPAEDDDAEVIVLDNIKIVDEPTPDKIDLSKKLNDPGNDLDHYGKPHMTDNIDRMPSKKNAENLKTDQKSNSRSQESPSTSSVLFVSNKSSIDPNYPIKTLEETYAWSEDYTFPTWEECTAVKERADSLPDLLHIPFEQSVQDVVLEGWEDEWVAKARFRGPKLREPKIDFVYNWVNGSQPELQEIMRPYELNSSLNDPDEIWIDSHGTNRYREWDELRYSVRSVEKYAGTFVNRIQILVNAFYENQQRIVGKQRPHWLQDDLERIQVLSQEQFFGPEERMCLPSFDSLTIENQLYNTKSDTDVLFALSDDMILGKPHTAADLYSPLFGPTLGFKDNAYNTLKSPTESDAERFGEKPFLIYTSWLLNRRFGARKRKGQVHFGHSLSRSVAKEAIVSFPRPALRSAVQRFRGEMGFQLYSWYVMFHYRMERHREALLWSYIMLRSDRNDDGYLDWTERKMILRELMEGMANEDPEQYRRRMYYRIAECHEEAGLESPKVNTDVLWTSLDGPIMIKGLDCDAFDVEECLGPGFSIPVSDRIARNPSFASAAVFERVSRVSPQCGDCLLKIILNRRRSGLGTLLPHAIHKRKQRDVVVKALMKFHYTVVNPDALFYMVTDAEQARNTLLKPYIKHHKKVGQMCLNDDVVTEDVMELEELKKVMRELFEGMLPEPSSYEKKE